MIHNDSQKHESIFTSVKVEENNSVVMLITDPKSRIPAFTEKTNENGVVISNDEDEDLKEGLDDHFRDVRVNSYLKIARDKYKGRSSDEIVDTIDKGNPDLRFMDDKEKDLFRNAWNKENTKGTFKYFMSLSNDELKDYQNNFSHHDFENPAEHSPEFVAWKKACEIKKCLICSLNHLLS